MESFIFPTLDHASPTHFVKRTLHWLPLILPSTYWSRFYPSDLQTKNVLNLQTIYLSIWTQDVHSGGILTRAVLCFFKSSFTLSVYCAWWTSAIGIFTIRVFANWVFKRICGFGRNPFLHNLLITPTLFLIHDPGSSVITLFFFSTYSKTFASKSTSSSYSVNPVSKYFSLDSHLSLV